MNTAPVSRASPTLTQIPDTFARDTALRLMMLMITMAATKAARINRHLGLGAHRLRSHGAGLRRQRQRMVCSGGVCLAAHVSPWTAIARACHTSTSSQSSESQPPLYGTFLHDNVTLCVVLTVARELLAVFPHDRFLLDSPLLDSPQAHSFNFVRFHVTRRLTFLFARVPRSATSVHQAMATQRTRAHQQSSTA
jgi:hypothetical protein